MSEPSSPPAEPTSQPCRDVDPLRAQRTGEDPPLDVLLSGTVFFDLVFTGLSRLPRPGEELWAPGLGSAPGGIANLAVAASRLGLRTGLVAGFGDDAFARWCHDVLGRQEHIDLSASPRFAQMHTSVTCSVDVGDDRAMVTHGHALPQPLDEEIAAAPAARTAMVDLAGQTGWWQDLAARGTRIVADVGFDETGTWDPERLRPLEHCHAFTPNAVEAMGFTRTDSAAAAARALADRVPLVIVTDGASGAYAIDQTTGEEAHVPALHVDAVDATGAGDVFGAAAVLGMLAGWPLVERLKFSALCSALAVQEFGGSLAAPGWGDLTDWWRTTQARTDAEGHDLVARYGFLEDLLPEGEVEGVRRAEATFALWDDRGPGA